MTYNESTITEMGTKAEAKSIVQCNYKGLKEISFYFLQSEDGLKCSHEWALGVAVWKVSAKSKQLSK
jgi:hypothetical protein